MTRLLIVDDDYSLYNLLSDYLGEEGFCCFHAPDAASGLKSLADEAWDIVILDVMLPGKNGFEILRDVRANPALQSLPVLMLTARGEESDKVAGLEMGADDYLAKPFSVRELVARLRALLRRISKIDNTDSAIVDVLRLDDIIVNKGALSLTVNGIQAPLTLSELRLLETFAEAPGEVIGRNSLSHKIFGHPPFPQDRSLDMLVSRLRKKLGPRSDGGERIRAARGEGYIFLLPGDKQ